MSSSLESSGYVAVERFIDQQWATALHVMFVLRAHRGETRIDAQVPGARSFWGDSTLDALLVSLLPDVERVAGTTLVPTYCYGRLYRHGDELPRHIDRTAAQVVASIQLGYRGAAPPAIHFALPGGDQIGAVTQRPGDAVVFLGSQLEHWRPRFTGDEFGQVFLNYVRADCPQAEHALDGRAGQFPPLLRDLVGA